MDVRQLIFSLETLLQCPYIDAGVVARCFLGVESVIASMHGSPMIRLRVYGAMHHASLCPSLLAELHKFGMRMKVISLDHLLEPDLSLSRRSEVKKILDAADRVIAL